MGKLLHCFIPTFTTVLWNFFVLQGALCGTFGWGTALQPGSSRVPFPAVSFKFFSWNNTFGPLWPWVWLSFYHKWVTKQVKFPHYRPGVSQRMGRRIDLPFHDSCTLRRWGVSVMQRPHFTPWKVSVPIYRRLCVSQGRSGRTEKSTELGFEPGSPRNEY